MKTMKPKMKKMKKKVKQLRKQVRKLRKKNKKLIKYKSKLNNYIDDEYSSGDEIFKDLPRYEYTNGYKELYGSSDMKYIIKAMEKADVYQVVYHLRGDGLNGMLVNLLEKKDG